MIAIGKSRLVKFRLRLDRLHATHHSVDHFHKESLEHLIFHNQTQQLYRECCLSLQKIIELCNRLTRDNQYHILSDLFIDFYASILMFRSVHDARGAKESIDFLENWHKNMASLVMTYCVITNDLFKVERLYYLISTLLKEDKEATKEIRKVILSRLPELEGGLDDLENAVLEANKHQDFYSNVYLSRLDFLGYSSVLLLENKIIYF